MKNKSVLITLKKELRSIFRDKKTIAMILGFPFIIAIFIFFFGYMEEPIIGEGTTEYSIASNYNINDVEKEFMKQYGLKHKYYKDVSLMKEDFDEGKISGFIEYQEEKNNYVVYAASDMTGLNVSSLMASYLEDYNQYLGNMKLVSQNIDPEEVFSNFTFEMKNIDGEELSSSSFMLEVIMSISFTYIIMAIALASVNMATSAIAVEKEHGTLETILTMPITVKDLIIGKYLATVVVGIISSVIGFILTIAGFGVASKMFDMYKDFSISFEAIFFGIVICIFASFLIAGLAIAITSSAKSYKEAQASGQILSLLCVVPMFFSYLEITITRLYYAIPILNYTTILLDLYNGNFEYLNLLITVGTTIVYIAVILYLMLKKFKSEKVLFAA